MNELAQHMQRLGIDAETRLLLLARLEGYDELDAVVRTCSTLPDGCLAEVHHAQTFFELASQGSHARRVLSASPRVIAQIAEARGQSFDADEMATRLAENLDACVREDDILAELRRFKTVESLRIFLREIDDHANVRQTSQEIADLAEACVRVAVVTLAKRRGKPQLASQFCVLGMGKLGGRELNFSSDIDLIFIADDACHQDLAELEAFARDLIAWIDRNTADGYVFRVDLRLRPEGSAGALVPAVSTARAYYEVWGRTWERSAMIKARPIAGNLALGDRLMTELEPFLYRKYLDYRAIDELRAMKEMIHRNAESSAIIGVSAPAAAETATSQAPMRDRLQAKLQMFGGSTRKPRPAAVAPAPIGTQPDASGVLGWDVKIGIGGIREVEFFVQALQLVHCGTRPDLRVRNTLDALDRLLFAGLLTHDDHATLADAYAFLRALEHRIQMEQDKQSHRTPADEVGFAQLAWRMGMASELLRSLIVGHRKAIRQMFDRLFSESEQTPERPTVGAQPEAEAEAILGVELGSLDTPPVHARLAKLGFERPRQVAGQLLILRQKNYGPFSDRAFAEDHRFALYLLSSCAGAPNPDQAFSHLTRFITLVGDRPGYFRMLAAHPHASRLLIHVFGSSPYLSAALLREPTFVERLLGAGSVAIFRSREDLLRDIRQRLNPIEDPEHRSGILRRFHQEETLRIGLHDYGGAATIVQTQEQLSNLAEVVIQISLEEVYEPLRSRKRRDDYKLPQLPEIPFCVVALGKLGSREMSFGSDLDLMFIYEYDRQWRLEHSFFAKLAQRLIRTLSMAGADGKMYEVDTRLRPSGQKGALVVSLDQYRSYQANNAALWERQALVRARPLTGPAILQTEFADVRHLHAFERGLPADGPAQLREMLGRIREALLTPGTLDIKYSPGGLVDIEFAVQAMQMRFGRQSEALRTTRTYDVLRALTAESQGIEADFAQLSRTFERLRTVESRLRMTDSRGISALPADPAQRNILARRLGFVGEEAGTQMTTELRTLMDNSRQICAQILDELAVFGFVAQGNPP